MSKVGVGLLRSKVRIGLSSASMSPGPGRMWTKDFKSMFSIPGPGNQAHKDH